MAQPIKIKSSAVQGKVPLVSDLIVGELAVNSRDGKLYMKMDNGTESIISFSTESHIHSQYIRNDQDGVIDGNLTVNRLSTRYYDIDTNGGEPTSNLGSPTLYELAIFEEQLNNKLEFYNRSSLVFESTTDNVNWSVIPVSDADVGNLIGGDNLANLQIPYGSCTKFRITVNNNNIYNYVNALYSYWSSNGNQATMKMYKQNMDGTWVQHTFSDKVVSSWPGHLFLPFNNIPWKSVASGGTQGTHYKAIRFEMTPIWNASYSNHFSFYRMQLWGGYPAGKRRIYSTDRDKNVTFPAKVTATTLLADKVETKAISFKSLFDNGTKTGNFTINVNNGQYQTVTLGANITLSITTPTQPTTFYLHVHQDGTGGRTLGLPAGKWAYGLSKSFTTTANGFDILMIHYYGGTNYVYEMMQDLK